MNDTVIYEPFKTVPLSKFHDELLFEFPKAPVQLFDYYVSNVAARIARDGKLVRRKAQVRARHCITRYPLSSPDGLEIIAILGIQASNCCFGVRSIARTITKPDGPRFELKEHIWFDDQDSVLHIETPWPDGVYDISLAVAPSRECCELPAIFAEELYDTLMLGVKGRILMIPDRPWTDVRLGASYVDECRKLVVGHSMDTALHKQRGKIRMAFGAAL